MSDDTVRNHLVKSILAVAAKVAIVVLPALGTSYFSYRQATTEAVSNTAVTKNKAEAGYQALVEASEKTGKIILDLEKNMARLEGRLQGMEIAFRISSPVGGGPGPVPSRPRPRSSGASPEPAPVAPARGPVPHAESPAPPPAPAAAQMKMAPPLPRTLDQAFDNAAKAAK